MSEHGNLLTTRQVAVMYGISLGRVRAIAAARGIAGRKFSSIKLWTPEEAARMKPGKRGRPKK